MRTPWLKLSPTEKAAILKPFLSALRAKRLGRAKSYQDCLAENRVRNRIRRLWDDNAPLDTPKTNRGIKCGQRPLRSNYDRTKYYWEK